MDTPSRQDLAAVWPPTRAASAQAGHRPMSPIQAIRRKCLDCSGHQLAEIKLCEVVTCSLWPFRAGRHPYTARGLLEADLAQSMSDGSVLPGTAAWSDIGLQDADIDQDAANDHGADRSAIGDEII